MDPARGVRKLKFVDNGATIAIRGAHRPMLKGIDPLLNADVLHALRVMGHGDQLVITDANFPAHACAESTVLGTPLRIDAPIVRVVEAVMSVMPLDTYLSDAAMRMEVIDAPDEMPPVQREVLDALRHAEGEEVSLVGVERFAFYDLAKKSFAVLQTAERRFYGCFILSKGVVPPEDEE